MFNLKKLDNNIGEHYSLNPGIIGNTFDRVGEPSQLLKVPNVDGGFNQLVLPGWLYSVLCKFDGNKTIEQVLSICEKIIESESHTVEKVRDLIANYCVEKKILVLPGEVDAYQQTAKRNVLKLRVPLIGASKVNSCAKSFRLFYNPVLLILLLVGSVGGIATLFSHSATEIFSSILTVNLIEVLVFIFIMVAGLLFHEFGHASAAYLYGCRNIEIGAGWYLIFLVFYADLSEAWSLNRKQRVVVDIGGMYFQIVFIGLLSLIAINYPNPVLYCSIAALCISLLWNLNPFFRMDGYWIVSDLLGVENLRERTSKETIDWIIRLIMGRGTKVDKRKIPSRTRKLLLTYVLLTNIAFFLLGWFFFSKLTNSLLATMTENYLIIKEHLLKGGTLTTFLHSVFELIWQAMIAGFIIYYLYKALSKLVKWFHIGYLWAKYKKTNLGADIV